MPERKILNIKSSPPLAETVGLLRGALQGMGIFAHSRPTQTGQIERLALSYFLDDLFLRCGEYELYVAGRTEPVHGLKSRYQEWSHPPEPLFWSVSWGQHSPVEIHR
jgi:hypothetical protein